MVRSATPKMRTPKRRTAEQWLRLKPATRGRYERAGVTRAYYMSGGSLQAARGHRTTPEHPGRKSSWVARAIQNDIRRFVPGFDKLPAAEQNQIAEWYVRGHFTKGLGAKLTRAERKARGILPEDRRTYQHFSDEQDRDRVKWQQLMVEIHGRTWDKEDYMEYREIYRQSFSSAS